MPARNIKSYIAVVAAAAAVGFGVAAPASALATGSGGGAGKVSMQDGGAQHAVLAATAIEYGLIAAL